MNVQIIWAMRLAAFKRGEMLRWLELLISVLVSIFPDMDVSTSFKKQGIYHSFGMQKSLVLLRWRMACLIEVPVPKPTAEISSPESQIRRMVEGFFACFCIISQ